MSHPQMTLATGLRLAFLLDNLNGGGVQRMTLALARCYRDRGHAVDLLVCDEAGILRDAVPEGVRLVGLERGSLALARLLSVRADPLGLLVLLLPVLLARKPHRTLAHLGALARYLRRERPDALLAAGPRINILAVWARRLAGTPTRVLVSERTVPSQDLARGGKWRKRALLPGLMRRAYAQANAVLAVSDGVAEDLAALTGLPRARILTVYNPVVGRELAALATAPVDHLWFHPGEPSVILGVGRLTEQKDFPTLVRAFARVRGQRTVRLVILGEALTPERTAARTTELRDLAASLGVADDLDLPGFVPNPYAYMGRSALFVLSSAWEGFGNVLVEAMACGCQVVSTDCPSGPSEILAGGHYGPLVPVGDDAALAAAIIRQLASPTPASMLRARASEFTVEQAADAYLHALFGDENVRAVSVSR
jgi:glycosyltransferase involved in cell wall biosynthesis